jgi:VanZ family protein
MYASLLRISGALHLGIFEQPAHSEFFSTLLGNDWSRRTTDKGHMTLELGLATKGTTPPCLMRRLAYVLPALVVAGTIFYLSSLEEIDLPLEGIAFNDLILHAAAYFVFGVTLLIAAYPANRLRTKPLSTYAIILAIGMAYGLSDEIHQFFVPNRDCSLADFCADTFGIAAALFGYVVWRRIKNRRSPASLRAL